MINLNMIKKYQKFCKKINLQIIIYLQMMDNV